MKIGDKLYCKRNYTSADSIIWEELMRNTIFFEKGNYYEVILLPDDELEYKEGTERGAILLKSKSQEITFYRGGYMPPYLWSYFYTPQELRKLKLQQLQTIL